MKLSEAFRYPHPVLSETSGDYIQDSLELVLEVDEQPQNGALTMRYDLKIDSVTIHRELELELAAPFLSVVCRDTFYSEFIPIQPGKGDVKIGGGWLCGAVAVRAVVVRLADGYIEASGLQSDYSTSKFGVKAGALLGWTVPLRFSVGMDKLAPMESVFKLSRDESLPKDAIGVSPDGDYISIRAPDELLQTISALRSTKSGQSVVLSAVYMPAIMSVLESLKDDGSYEGQRWHRILTAKAQSLGLDLTREDSLSSVQMLLKGPLARLKVCAEKMQ